MKSPARFLYVAADTVGPNGLAAFCTVALAALMIGMLKIRQLACTIARRGVARFPGRIDDSTAPDQGT